MTRRYEIAVVPGDGIGPEVCNAAVTVLGAAFAERLPFDYREYRAGADCYRETGEAFPVATMDGCRKAAAILHGAAGLPGVRYPDGTEAGQDFSLRLRFTLDLYANVRPIRLYPGVESPLRNRRAGDIDYVIVRENTEGLYAARGGGNLLRDEVATDTMVMTRKGVERIVRYAAELARRRNGAPLDGRRRVTICDKSNVLRSFAFFRRVAEETLAAYPDVEIDCVLVDAMCVHLIERPERFDVVVTENLVGDILSDLGAATVGGMGLSAAAEIGDGVGYFQASHGTAPDIAGKGVANPVATVLSAANMCEWLGERHADPAVRDAGTRIRAAVEHTLQDGSARTRDLGGTAGTAESTAAICQAIITTR